MMSIRLNLESFYKLLVADGGGGFVALACVTWCICFYGKIWVMIGKLRDALGIGWSRTSLACTWAPSRQEHNCQGIACANR
jgi:hypothetical protein